MESLEHREMLSGVPMLLDLNHLSASSSPDRFLEVGGKVFFTANDGLHGEELWTTDGTEGGTFQVKEISLGATSSSPRYLTNFGGTLYFSARGSVSAGELWKSDGTEQGTTRILGDAPNSPLRDAKHLTNVGGVLYFSATDGSNGNELWRSDGTAAGTMLVKNLRPSSAGSFPRQLTSVGGKLFFRAHDGQQEKLWVSDGTAAGTLLVTANGFSSGLSTPEYLTNVNGRLFFRTMGQLWSTDGTVAGTARAGSVTEPKSLVNYQGLLYFSGRNEFGEELWVSNGTAAGTHQVADLAPDSQLRPQHLTVIGDSLFFVADARTQGKDQLWRSNGTTAGTVPVFVPVQDQPYFEIDGLTNLGGRVMFRARDSVHGRELWITDGQQNEAAIVKDILAGNDSSLPSLAFNAAFSAASSAGNLYFAARDDVAGLELWKSDGTAGGTVRVKNVNQQTLGSDPGQLTNVSGKLFFTANDGVTGQELWMSDGTLAGTRSLDLLPGMAGSFPSHLVAIREWLYFIATTAEGDRGIWRTDGTSAGTAQVAPTFRPSLVNSLVSAYDSLFLAAVADDGGEELWKVHFYTEEVVRVGDVNPGAASSSPRNLTASGQHLYFTANDGAHGRELWRYDYFTASAAMVKDVYPGLGDSIYQPSDEPLIDQGKLLYFVASDGVASYELWATDGTEAGTVRLTDFNGNANSVAASTSSIEFFPYFPYPTLYLWVQHPTSGRELWKTAGTPETTELVDDIAPGAQDSTPRYFASVNGVLYFQASPYGNAELWKTAGGYGNAAQVKDIRPGNVPSDASWLTNAGGVLQFWANDGINGMEIWQSDGSSAGTRLLGNVVAGAAGATPNPLVYTSEGKTFFVADNGTTGSELWLIAEGDYDENRVIDGADFLQWQREHGAAVTPRGSRSDGDRSGTVDAYDLAAWKVGFGAATKVAPRGDYNRDGNADGADFLMWQRNFRRSPGVAGEGADGNGDFLVNKLDLDVWMESFGAPGAESVVNSANVAGLMAAEELARQRSEELVPSDVIASLPETHDHELDSDHRVRRRDALFAAGDFSRLFAADRDANEEWLTRRRGRGMRGR